MTGYCVSIWWWPYSWVTPCLWVWFSCFCPYTLQICNYGSGSSFSQLCPALACINGISALPLDLVSQHALYCHLHGDFRSVTMLSTSLNELYSDIRHFWELEEPPVSVAYTLTDDALAEDHLPPQLRVWYLDGSK